MSIIEKSIEVNVPEYTAYAQWTRFEEFPQFMEGVKEVQRLGPKSVFIGKQRSRARTKSGMRRSPWRPRTNVSHGRVQGGDIKGWVVRFLRLSDARRKVMLQS